MKFWDASAIVPLVVTESTTKALQGIAATDPAMLVWWATEVECASAIARLERDGAVDAAAAIETFDRLKRLADGWHEIDPSDSVREAAVRFLRVHPLRTTDALTRVTASGRPPSVSCESIPSAPLTRYNSRPLSSRQSAGHPHSN